MTTSNTYRGLLDLLPGRPLQAGTVAAVSGSAVTVTLPGGGTVQARGAATVGERVFVRDGLIEATAPSLTVVSIEV
jgi:hypothetical protein